MRRTCRISKAPNSRKEQSSGAASSGSASSVQSTGWCFLFERESGQIVSKIEFPDWAPCLRFDPTGVLLAVPGSDQGGARIVIYEMRSG
ncbi:MAG: hypothetical protein NT154_21425, partial [Verrucomicrobia bacterium]|nr:hypothetical protein [Verrucomicrobiota bacterium]